MKYKIGDIITDDIAHYVIQAINPDNSNLDYAVKECDANGNIINNKSIFIFEDDIRYKTIKN